MRSWSFRLQPHGGPAAQLSINLHGGALSVIRAANGGSLFAECSNPKLPDLAIQVTKPFFRKRLRRSELGFKTSDPGQSPVNCRGLHSPQRCEGLLGQIDPVANHRQMIAG